jgi:hypothetical protein
MLLTGKARAPCFRSAAIAGLNQRGVSQALTGTALPVARTQGAASASESSTAAIAGAGRLLSSWPGRRIAVMASSPSFHHHHAGIRGSPVASYGASSALS